MDKGGGVEGLLSLRQDAKDYYYIYDGKGNVTAVYDQEQRAVAQYAYDAFGELLAESASLVQPFRFSTKRYDELLGFYDYGYRRYSPLIHRWLTRDPIGLDGGTNLYGFVGNNPVNMIDPEGHCAVAGAIGGAAFDIGSQLFENNGKFSCINWGSVASSAAIGGLTCGVVGKLVQLKELGKLGQLMRKGTKGLGTNPFKGKTAQEIEKMLLEKGYTPKGPNPLTGHGTYVNPKSGRAFHIDALHPPPKPPHVGVYRPRSARDLDISSVREYPLN
jgi:RHS repeat-associated protein